MNTTTTLMNFNIPSHLKTNLDNISKFKRLSKTSIINNLIEKYCRKEYRNIQEDGELNYLIKDIEDRNPLKEPESSQWEDSYIDDPREMVGMRQFMETLNRRVR